MQSQGIKGRQMKNILTKKQAIKISAITLSGLLLVACGGSSNKDKAPLSGTMPTATNTYDCAGNATEIASLDKNLESTKYSITFTSIWDATNFPTNFPGNPHFSPLVGASHSDQETFWKTTGTATAGIEQMAESGGTSTFKTEISTAINNSQAKAIISGGGISSASGSSCTEGQFDNNNPLLTITSMIAPSPDWFVGLSNRSLKENGEWITTAKVDARLYDAGTDGGEQFASLDDDAGREDVISRLTTPASDSDFSDGVHRTDGKHVGYFTIQRIK